MFTSLNLERKDISLMAFAEKCLLEKYFSILRNCHEGKNTYHNDSIDIDSFLYTYRRWRKKHLTKPKSNT